jgi:cell division protease FtsH
LFWVMMIALAVVLWEMGSRPNQSKSGSALSYSDFMRYVDQNNIASVRLLESPSIAEIQGQLREPAQNFSVTIPKEVIPELTERLRKQGTSVEVSEIKEATWINILIDYAPILLIVGVWVFMMKRMQFRRNPPAQSGPSTGALG